MIKHLSPFQGIIMSIILRALICLTFLRSCCTRNSFSNLDFSTQTLNPVVTGFKVTGSTSDQLGSSVSTAGDINNDGYDDIILGAPRGSGGRGAVYVIYGGEESAFLNIDLSTTSLNPHTTGFVIVGNGLNNQFGYTVSTAGDINNDGYDDVIVGTSGANSEKGEAYLIYGGDKSIMSNIYLSSTTLDPHTTGFKITGSAAGDNLGVSVSTAGDINKDGYDDIIIGARGKSSGLGAAYVIYGGEKSAMSNWDFSSGATLNPTSTGFMITGPTGTVWLGVSVSPAGDMNHDGYDDIIIGSYSSAYVFYGGEKGSMSNIALSSTTTLDPHTVGFKMTGAIGDFFGQSVSTAGDINKDGYDDIIVGAYNKNNNQGAAYVIYGGEKSSMSNIALSSTTLNPLTTGFMITGNAANNQLGWSVSAAGDVNNDGYDDIIIGAREKNAYQGAAYMIYGREKSSMSNIALSSFKLDPLTTGYIISGNLSGDHTGYSVSKAGDINNDGYDDIIVGASLYSVSKGAVYVIYAGCPKNCKQCSSESQCTECHSPYLLHQSECLTSCSGATVATTTTCEDCPAHCNQCSSPSVCTKCKNSYLMYQSECFASCPDTTFASTNTACIDCPAHCSHCTSTSVCIECLSPFVLYRSQCLISCPKAMFNSNNVCKKCPSYCSSCLNQEICQVCFQGFNLTDSRCVLSSTPTPMPVPESSSLQVQEKAIKAIPSTTQGIGSVICVGSTVFPFSKLVSKIVQNTRYLNLSVTTELSEVYKTWQTNIISWNVPSRMSHLDHFEISPPLFAQYDLGSPFLVNFWPILINIGIGFSTFTTCILLLKFCEYKRYEGWGYSLLLKLVAGSFNFVLVQAYACLDDILFYLVLDIKTNPLNSFFSRASIACGVIFLTLGCLLVLFNFWTVYKYQDMKKQGGKDLIEAFNERNKYWELFYSDFNDEDLWSQSFFATLIIRSALTSCIITALYDYPLLQTSYLVILDVAIISLLYLKNPFNTLRGKLAQYYYEIITFLVHLCSFILSMQDTFENSSDTIKLIMSKGILYLNTALVGGTVGFMFIEIYKTISQKTKAGKLKQYETIAIQTVTENDLKTETQRRLDENFYLFSGINQSGPSLESSQIVNFKSNLDPDSSRDLKIDQSDRINQEGDQSTVPVFIKRKLRMLKPRQQIY